MSMGSESQNLNVILHFLLLNLRFYKIFSNFDSSNIESPKLPPASGSSLLAVTKYPRCSDTALESMNKQADCKPTAHPIFD